MTTPGAPPVVFVHGWGSTFARTWGSTALARNLQCAGRRVVGVDLLGHGKASAPRDTAAYAGIADDLASRLPDDEVLEGVGFSLGGKLLLELACRLPHRFRKLVIIGVGENLFRPENGRAVAEALFAGVAATTPAPLRPVVAEALASGNDLRALAAAIQRPPTVMTRVRLKEVLAEVLVAVGDRDVIAGSPAPVVEALLRASALVLPGVDHLTSPRSALLQERSETFLLADAARATGRNDAPPSGRPRSTLGG